MFKPHLKARRGASQGGTPLAEIDSTSVESAWSVTPSTTVVSSRINHNEGAENARRQTDKETGQNVQHLMTTTPRRTSL